MLKFFIHKKVYMRGEKKIEMLLSCGQTGGSEDSEEKISPQHSLGKEI